MAYAINLISNGSPSSYPKSKDVEVLAKYYKHEGIDNHEIRQKLYEYCIKTDPLFNMVLNGWKIDRAMNKIKNYRLRTTFPIIVTKSEVAKIKQFDNYNYQKVIFVMIVISKFLKYSNVKIKANNKTIAINEFFINNGILQIIKMAKISIRKKERIEMVNKFYEMGILDGTYKHVGFKIKCIDENSEPEIVVTDFDNIVLYWARYSGEKIAGCSNCGKLFIKRSNRHAMCRSCWKEREKELWRLNKQKIKI